MSSPAPGVSTPTFLSYRDVINVSMDPSNDVNFADTNNYGHRIQIPIGKSLFNLFFRWRRNIGEDRPVAKINTSEVVRKTFKTVMVNGFNTSIDDIDGITGGLHFGTANMSLNTDPRLRKNGLVSANDIPMAFILYRLYGNSAVSTKNYILNLQDAYDMLTSEALADTIMNSFISNEATALDSMFRDLLSQDPKRFFDSQGRSEPNMFETNTDNAGEGSWKLAANDIIEIKTKLIFHSKITKRGLRGDEHFLSDTDSAKNQQNIIIPDDYFYIRLQLKVVDDGVVADPTNLTYSNSSQTVVTGYTGVINGEIIIPSGVTSIANGAFTGQTGLTEVLIPQTVTTIGDEAFKGTGLTTIFMPNVTVIGARSFENCASLTTVIAPELTEIGTDAFKGCIALTSLNSYSINNPAVEPFMDINTTSAGGNYVIVNGVIDLNGIEKLESGAFANCQSIESIVIPTTITSIPSGAFSGTTSLTSIVIPTSVTNIGASAFSGAGLTSITLHSGITSIGAGVFENATNLTSVAILGPITTLPANIFKGANNLTTVDLPPTITTVAAEAFKATKITSLSLPNVTSIAAGAFASIPTLVAVSTPSIQAVSQTAFSGSTSLQSAPADPSSIVYSDSTKTTVTGYTGSIGVLQLPASVTAIADNAFLNNMNVIGLNLNGGVIETIGHNAFKGSGLRTLTLVTGLSFIGNNAFQNCVNLTTLVIPQAPIMSFGTYCFAGCSKLTSINIPNGVTSIPIHCFNGCALMTTVTSHNGITSIGEYAFNGCAALTSFTIPSGVTTLAPYSFAGCSSLTSLTLPTNLTNYQTACLSGTGLTSVTFPEVTTTNIGNEVLANCTALTSVTFPNKAPSGGLFPLTLGTAVLKGCSALTSFTIPSLWTSLTTSFFENSGLTSITIPSNITAMGTSVFKGCSGLTTATVNAAMNNLPTSTFENCTSLASVSLASSILTINTSAFRNSRLVSFVSTTVTTVLDFAFADNPALTTLDAVNVTSLAINAISGAPNLVNINISALPPASVHLRASSYSGSGAWTNNGTLGATHNATVSSGTPAKNSAGNGVVFNNNLRFAFPNIPSITVYSQSLWIKRPIIAGGTIMSQQNSGGSWIGSINGDGMRGFSAGYYRNGGWIGAGTVSPNAGEWAHIVFVYTGTSWKSYLNGELQSTIPISTAPTTTTAQYFIGANWDGTASFQGELGELRFYNIALTDDQVKFINIFTSNSFTNPAPGPAQMLIRFNASSYSGSGAWLNQGTLGSTHNATISAGTPAKNSAGNGIVFNRDLRFSFPTFAVTPNYTHSVWVKRKLWAGTILSQQRIAGNSIGPSIWGNGSRQFFSTFRINDTQLNGSGADTDLDIWYNLTFTFNGTNLTTYINGVYTGRVNLTGRFVETTNWQYFIGANWDASIDFTGEIGEIRIYNGALTATEVANIYSTTVATYPNTTSPPTQMLVRFNAITYSGSGAWTNNGTLGSTHNATVQVGTPTKNSAGNGIVFNRNLRFGFPSVGFLKNFTYSLWMKRTSYSGWIISQQLHPYQHSGPGITADNGSQNILTFRSSGGDIYGSWFTTQLYDWNNLTITFDGINIITYLNGARVNSARQIGRFVEATEYQYFIGADWGGNLSFVGEIGEFRMYNGALSATEVADIYNATASNYVTVLPSTQMLVRYVASNYSGTGAWTNEGTLGSTHNATVGTGTPSKNAAGNGVIFNRNLRFQFPTLGGLRTYTQSVWIRRTGQTGNILTQQYGWQHNSGPNIFGNGLRGFHPFYRILQGDVYGPIVDTDPNVWVHLTFVFDGTNWIVYRNGVSLGSTSVIGRNIEAQEYQYYIGADWSGNPTFGGELGELRFYNGALTAAEVLDIYNTTAGNYPNGTPSNDMLVCFTANTYSGSGAWTNTGTLGTANNATVHTGTPSKNGNGVVFDGNLVFKFPNIGAVPIYTQSIWFMRTNNARSLISQEYDHGTHNVGPYITNDGSTLFYGRFRVAQGDFGGGGVATVLNTWHHLVITFDRYFMNSYLDGRLVNQARVTREVETNFNQYFIGGNWSAGDRFIGRIGDVRMYNYAFDATAVKSLYDSTNSLYLVPTTPADPTVNMLVRFTASEYSGSGAWTNTGTLGTANNAALQVGTPTKNAAGNGIVFNSNLRFGFPTVGTLTNHTMSIWLKRTGQPSLVMAQQNIGNNFMGLINVSSSRALYGGYYRNGGWYGSTGVEFERDTWVNLTFVYNGSQFVSYLNGNLTGVTSITVAPQQSGGTYFIGADWNGSVTFRGEIGEIRLYSGALNDTMVQEIYTSTVANYPNPAPSATQMLIRYEASSYSGSGAWTNQGTLGSTHNAAIQGGTPSKNSAGNGVVFNGLVYRFPSTLRLRDYTISYWFKRTGIVSYLLSQQIINSSMIHIDGHSGRQIRPITYLNQGWYYGGSVTTESNVWYNLVIVRSGTQILTYLDGTLRATVDTKVPSEESDGQYYIGGHWDGWAGFTGEIGEFRMYNGALTASEIANIYNTTVATYPNVSPPTEMRIRYVASNYSGSGAWTNEGTLGTTHNATIRHGTPSKNSSGNGVVFNGGLTYQFPHIGDVNRYTISIWMRRTVATRMMLIQQNSGQNWAGGIDGNGGNQFYARWLFNGGWYYGTAVTTDPENWFNLTFVWDGLSIFTYFNGTLHSRNVYGGIAVENNGLPYFLAGNWDGWSSGFVGEIGEFRFYNGALSAGSVGTLYTSTAANFVDIVVPTEMKIRFVASDYSGSGAWTNVGTLGSANNATIRSGTPSKNAAGNGIVFNGGLVYQFPHIGATPRFTMSFWIKRTALAGMFFMQQGSGNTYGPGVDGVTRTFYTRSIINGGWWFGQSVDTDQNVWVNLVYVWTGSQMIVYKDGEFVSSSIFNTAVESGGTPFSIGGNWDGTPTFNGEIGEIRFYNGILTASEIASIYNAGSTIYLNPPVVRELRIHFSATTYSGSGAWTNSGTLGSSHNAVIQAGTPSKSGNGVVFNGGLVFRFPTFGSISRFTQSVWIRRTSSNNGQHIMSQQNNGQGTIAGILRLDNTVIYHQIAYANWWPTSSGLTLPNLNTWYMVTLVWDGLNMTTYLNGSVMSITNIAGAFVEQNGLQYFFGGNWDGTPTLNAHIGELRLYNGVMNSTEVRDLYTSTAATFS